MKARPDRSEPSIGQVKEVRGSVIFRPIKRGAWGEGRRRRPEASNAHNGRQYEAIVRAGRISALFGQRVGRAELGDIGDEVAGFRFGNEAGFFGEEEDAFVHRGRDRPGENDAGH